jgi:hypothetical protein
MYSLRKKLLVTGLFLVNGPSAFSIISSETERASKDLGANMVSEISFDKGQSVLTENLKRDIETIVSSAKQSGSIREIKVAVWSDQEYPNKNTKITKSEVTLAEGRATNIKKYILNNLNVPTVVTYNMSQRPNSLQKFLKTGQADLKATMETTGAAPTSEQKKGIFDQKAQASKAVVLIYTK